MTQKLERVLQLQLLLLLPSQLALHFWPSWSLINGIRVDYLSPTLYLTDILIILLWLFNSPLHLPSLKLREGKGVSYFRFGLVIFITLNILFSFSPLLTIYKWFRVLEYFWLFKYLTKKNLALSTWPLALSVIWTSALAWWQFFLQHSVGGLWWWLGERPLSVAAPLIAKVSFAGQLVMRSYATFPHPNALAGFLLVAALLLYRRVPWATALAFLTIPITFSRTAIVLEIGILLIWISLKIKNLKLKIATSAALLLSTLYFLLSITGSPVSFLDRQSLNHLAISTIQQFPFLGVGLGNFLPATGLLQPVHNIYLLLASELGIPAVAVIGYWLMVHGKKLLSTMNYELITAITVIAITGAADHYWVTLHQPALLLVVLLAIIKVKSMNHEL